MDKLNVTKKPTKKQIKVETNEIFVAKPTLKPSLKLKTEVDNNLSVKERYKLSKQSQQNIVIKDEIEFNPAKSQKYKIKTKKNKRKKTFGF